MSRLTAVVGCPVRNFRLNAFETSCGVRPVTVIERVPPMTASAMSARLAAIPE
jgi:hypothetical protein